MTRCTFIIPAAKRATANQAALQFDPVGGAKSFGPPVLRAIGGTVATHCWASGLVHEEFLPALEQMAPAFSAIMVQDLDPFAVLHIENFELVPTQLP